MGDTHHRDAAVPADTGGSVPWSTFPRGIPSEVPPSLSSYPIFGGVTALPVAHSPYLKYIDASQQGAYGYNDFGSNRVQPETAMGSLRVEANMNVYESSLAAPNYLHNGRDIIADIGNARPDSLGNANNSYDTTRESNILFVDGLPTDCTRREVSHLFRPFMGYKEIRVVHKEPRRIGEKAMVFCFVEFIDSNHASTAMEALQGYQFDDKKLDGPTLKIQFAHFPFRLNHGKQ